MSALATTGNALPPTPPETIEKIARLEVELRKLPAAQIQTEHVIHAGMYARTVRLPADMVVTNTIIKIPTLLIVHGRCALFAGKQWHEIKDYQVIPGSAGRKQVVVTIEPTAFTMVFATKARTVAEAEAEFTDQADDLISRAQGDNDLVLITGADACRE